MLKIVAAALAAAVVVTGLPILSQAGCARGDRGADCRLCKMFTHKRVRATKPVVRRAVRAERRMFAWPKRVRSESLFKRAPREARPVVKRTRREWKPMFTTRRAHTRVKRAR